MNTQSNTPHKPAKAILPLAEDAANHAIGDHVFEVDKQPQEKPRYKMEPTNAEHQMRVYTQSEMGSLLLAPASIHTADALHTKEEVGALATTLRCSIKEALQDGLLPKFVEFGGESRVYFKPVLDPNMGMHAFLKDVELAHFPEWIIGHIYADDGYLRTNRKGWTLIEQYGTAHKTEGGHANAREPYAAYLRDIADVIFDVNRTLCDEYESWLKSELGITDVDEVLSTDQLYLALEHLLLKVPTIPLRIKQLIA